MSADTPQQPSGLEELGTPPQVRQERPALYPEDAALDGHAPEEPDPEVHADPDTSEVSGQAVARRRHGVAGAWDNVAYWVQWVPLQLYGAAAQSRKADPIERLKRRYGRPERRF